MEGSQDLYSLSTRGKIVGNMVRGPNRLQTSPLGSSKRKTHGWSSVSLRLNDSTTVWWFEYLYEFLVCLKTYKHIFVQFSAQVLICMCFPSNLGWWSLKITMEFRGSKSCWYGKQQPGKRQPSKGSPCDSDGSIYIYISHYISLSVKHVQLKTRQNQQVQTLLNFELPQIFPRWRDPARPAIESATTSCICSPQLSKAVAPAPAMANFEDALQKQLELLKVELLQADDLICCDTFWVLMWTFEGRDKGWITASKVQEGWKRPMLFVLHYSCASVFVDE